MEDFQRLPVGDIIPNRKNPRKYFDATEMAELQSAIFVQNLLAPILVRPISDVPGKTHEIIAGERRWRAFTAARPGELIPAFIREVSDGEVDLMALSENIQRAPMSPTEEAEAANDLVKRYGSKEEAASRLGMNPATLNRRLALLRCIPEVRTALNERRIDLGHAELLAAITEDKQQTALNNILLGGYTVAQTKEALGYLSQSLEVAIFDKTECTNCNYNSTAQRSLFAETVADGYCTNAVCYKDKTDKKIQVLKDHLAEDYPRVEVISEANDISVVAIVADNAGNAIGAEQAKACRSCQNFGCTVSAFATNPGEVERNLCFDPACNLQKATIWLKEVKATKTAPAASKDNKSNPAKSESATKIERPVTINKRVHEYRVGQWRIALANHLFLNPGIAKKMLVTLALSGRGREMNAEKVRVSYEKLTGQKANHTGLVELFNAVDNGETMVDTLLVRAAASSAYNLPEHDLKGMMETFKIDMTARWKLNAEFLGLMTKIEIEAVCEEVGIRSAIGKDWQKTITSKKDDLIKAILSVPQFEYTGKVPKVMQYTGKMSCEPSDQHQQINGESSDEVSIQSEAAKEETKELIAA